jgi:hypothetical protein
VRREYCCRKYVRLASRGTFLISDKTTVWQVQIKYIQSQINTEIHKTARHKLATLKPGLKTPLDRSALHCLKKNYVSQMGSMPSLHRTDEQQ